MIEQLDVFAPPARPSLADQYAAWRTRNEGDLFVREVEARALEEARLNPRRIEVNRIWADVRRDRQCTANNSFRAFCARELKAKHPMLRDLIETRGHA